MSEKVVDHLGRIVIPKVFRNQLGLTEGTPIYFRADTELGILIVEKAQRGCLKCHRDKDLIEIKAGAYLCSDCLQALKTKSE